MTKVKITVPYPVLQVLQNFLRRCQDNPGYDPKSGYLAYFALREWAMSSASKLFPEKERDVRFTLRTSQALALATFLKNIAMAEGIYDAERSQVIDQIRRQIPFMLNQSPV